MLRLCKTISALPLLLATSLPAPAEDGDAVPLATGRLNQVGYFSELAGKWSPTTKVIYCADRAAAERYARERARLHSLGFSGRPLAEALGRTLRREGQDCGSDAVRVRLLEGGEVIETAMRTADGRPLYLVETELRGPNGTERRVFALFSDWQIEKR